MILKVDDREICFLFLDLKLSSEFVFGLQKIHVSILGEFPVVLLTNWPCFMLELFSIQEIWSIFYPTLRGNTYFQMKDFEIFY